ncbi:MAG: type 4a pilus biogenesis protein PilO [Phycisphaerales bacterium]|nr:type 4a pilus biogenesis protein PilO [Phycisphaerales bacterium]
MTNKTLRQTGFVFTLVCIPVLSWVLVFQPQQQEIDRAIQEIDSRNTELEKVALLTRRIPDLEDALATAENLVTQIEAKLPPRRDVEVVLEQTWQIAERNGLTVRSFKTKPAVPSGLYMELPLEVSMSGPFEGFYRFLIDLEGLPRITRIAEMSIQESGMQLRGPGNELPPGSIAAQFVLSVYFSDSVPTLAEAGDRP